MRIAVTGATGFLGRHIVNHLLRQGHDCRCWYRPDSDRGGFDEDARGKLEWLPGQLNDQNTTDQLVQGVDAVVHAALYRLGTTFRRDEGDVITFADLNVFGALNLIEAAKRAGVKRFVFISSCAVHEAVLDDRPLDEKHPMWPTSHYGAHKAAIEEFVYSYGLGHGYDICALRPTGIYGVARPVQDSKWFDLVQKIKTNQPIESSRGGKEVHAADVAKAAGILLTAKGIAGQSYNCYDMYISDEEVARIAKELTGSKSVISKSNQGPKNQIITEKIRALGMTFSGRELLTQTIQQMIAASP